MYGYVNHFCMQPSEFFFFDGARVTLGDPKPLWPPRRGRRKSNFIFANKAPAPIICFQSYHTYICTFLLLHIIHMICIIVLSHGITNKMVALGKYHTSLHIYTSDNQMTTYVHNFFHSKLFIFVEAFIAFNNGPTSSWRP